MDVAYANATDAESDLASQEDFVDVYVNIDISHVMGVAVQSNTMEMLVSLELEWYDDRLHWEPFLGACQRASFRAALDPEVTEIWVPKYVCHLLSSCCDTCCFLLTLHLFIPQFRTRQHGRGCKYIAGCACICHVRW